MKKKYTSNVEEKRLDFEEIQRTKGSKILPQQIWRDGALIPGSPKDVVFEIPKLEEIDGINVAVQYFHINDGATEIPLIKKFNHLLLKQVKGTTNVFHSEHLINIIGKEFDKTPDDPDLSWNYILALDDKILSYNVGDPYIDGAAGTLTFNNKKFVDTLTTEKLYITFYRYCGRTGFLGASNNLQDMYGGADLPFRDDIKHFKDHTNDNRTAQFIISGEDGNTKYILPAGNKVFRDDNGNIVDESGLFFPGDSKKGIVMLQENYQEIDWNIGLHNGGTWSPDGSVTKY